MMKCECRYSVGMYVWVLLWWLSSFGMLINVHLVCYLRILRYNPLAKLSFNRVAERSYIELWTVRMKVSALTTIRNGQYF